MLSTKPKGIKDLLLALDSLNPQSEEARKAIFAACGVQYYKNVIEVGGEISHDDPDEGSIAQDGEVENVEQITSETDESEERVYIKVLASENIHIADNRQVALKNLESLRLNDLDYFTEPTQPWIIISKGSLKKLVNKSFSELQNSKNIDTKSLVNKFSKLQFKNLITYLQTKINRGLVNVFIDYSEDLEFFWPELYYLESIVKNKSGFRLIHPGKIEKYVNEKSNYLFISSLSNNNFDVPLGFNWSHFLFKLRGNGSNTIIWTPIAPNVSIEEENVFLWKTHYEPTNIDLAINHLAQVLSFFNYVTPSILRVAKQQIWPHYSLSLVQKFLKSKYVKLTNSNEIILETDMIRGIHKYLMKNNDEFEKAKSHYEQIRKVIPPTRLNKVNESIIGFYLEQNKSSFIGSLKEGLSLHLGLLQNNRPNDASRLIRSMTITLNSLALSEWKQIKEVIAVQQLAFITEGLHVADQPSASSNIQEEYIDKALLSLPKVKVSITRSENTWIFRDADVNTNEVVEIPDVEVRSLYVSELGLPISWQRGDETSFEYEGSSFTLESAIGNSYEINRDKDLYPTLNKFKIVLVSQKELEEELQFIERQIARKNDELAEQDVYIELKIWEKESAALSETPSQYEYNRLIENCDLFVMLAWTKVGMYTEEEFDKVLESFKWNGAPETLIYFKKDAPDIFSLPDDWVSLSIFQKRLDNLGYLYSSFDSSFDLWHQLDDSIRRLMELGVEAETMNLASTDGTPELFDESQTAYEYHDCEDLKPEVVMGQTKVEAAPFIEYYLERKHDKKLGAHLARAHQPTLITGDPLSGKSRAVFQLLNGQSEYVLCKPIMNRQRQPLLPKIAEGKTAIVFFDDLQQYLSPAAERLALLVQLCLDNGVKIVATLRRGPELDRVKATFSLELWNAFDNEENRFNISKMKWHETNAIRDNIKEEKLRFASKEGFDGTIGSLFLDLEPMRRRYDKLRNLADKLDKTHLLIADSILFGLKIHYLLYNYEDLDPTKYSVKKLKEYARLENQLDNISSRDWERALGELEQTDRGRSFLKAQGDYLFIEEAYLSVKKEVIAPNLTIKEAFNQVYNELYKYNDVLEKWGWAVNTFHFNEIMKGVQSLEEALVFRKQMEELGAMPDVYTFAILMQKSGSYNQAQSFNVEMLACGISPNEVTYSTLINKGDFVEGKGLLDEMLEKGIKPDEVTYSTLINKGDFGEGKGLLDEMLVRGIPPNEVTFNTLINKGSFSAGKGLLDEMLARGISPNEVTFNTMINKGDFVEGKDLLDEMLGKGLKPDEVTFNTLINKGSFEEGKDLLDEMLGKGLKPDEVTFNTLINKGSFEESKGLLNEMTKRGLKPDIITIDTLTRKAKKGNQDHINTIINALKQYHIKSDERFKITFKRCTGQDLPPL